MPSTTLRNWMRKRSIGTTYSHGRHIIQHRHLPFMDTFVILSKMSFLILGLNLMRNHQAVIDTANGTIDFPHVEMTLAMTDEMKICKPLPLQISTEGNQTLFAITNNNSECSGNHHQQKWRHWRDATITTFRRNSPYIPRPSASSSL